MLSWASGSFFFFFFWRGPERNVSRGDENLISDSLCCSIQAGNVSSFSLGRKNIKSSHFSWILLSSKLDFGFGDSPNKEGEGFEPGARWDLFGPLLASLNYSVALVLSSPAACWLLKVCVCPSVSRLRFHFFIKVGGKKNNSRKEVKGSADKSDTKWIGFI